MDVLSWCDICCDCFFHSVGDKPSRACLAVISWSAYMCACVIMECEAAPCVRDCHVEGQSSGLELHREQEGCNNMIAAKSQPADCCCSVICLVLAGAHSEHLCRSVSICRVPSAAGCSMSQAVTDVCSTLGKSLPPSLQRDIKQAD